MSVWLYRVHHGPVQRVGEELRPGRRDLLDQTLYVLAFLLRVDAPFGSRDFSTVQSQTLVVVAVVQRDQLPFARLLIGLFVVKFVEDAFHGGQLLPLPSAELAGTVGGAWRREKKNNSLLIIKRLFVRDTAEKLVVLLLLDSPSLRLRPIFGRCSSGGWTSGVFSPGMMMPQGDSLPGVFGVAFPLAEDTEGAVVIGRITGLSCGLASRESSASW